MSMVAIANITEGRNTVGLRIMNIETKQVKDVTIGSVYKALTEKNAQIINIEAKNGQVIGSNGAIDRLPKIVNGQLRGKSPLMVINQLGDEGYTVVDFKGEVATMSSIEAIQYAKTQGIANGKLVIKEGTEFISSINGEYEKVETEQKLTLEQRIERANMKLEVLEQPYRVEPDGGIKLLNKNIEVLHLADAVRRLNDYMLNNCTTLTRITLSKNLIDIGAGALAGCTGLTEIEIPETVRYIGAGAFLGCTGITRIVIPEGVTNMSMQILKGCSGLESVDFRANVKELGSGFFSGCRRLQYIELPDTIEKIGESAFSSCSELRSVKLPSNLKSIGKEAFKGCSKLEVIDLPRSVEKLGADAFSSCTALKEIITTRALFFDKVISTLPKKIKITTNK